MLLLFTCLICLVLEIKSEEAVVTLYRLKGRSVCLDVRSKPPYKDGRWSYGEKNNVMIASATDINPNYTARIHYNQPNSTLCIKNLTEKDSGIYIFSFLLNYDGKKKTYKLNVEEAVPEPALSLTVLHSNSSVGSCTVSVNCSVRNDWLCSVCDKDGCQASNKSFSQVNISISSDNRRVTCTGNNHVSAREASQDTAVMCFSSDSKVERQSYFPWIWISILIAIVLLIGLFMVFIFYVAKKLKSSGRILNQPQVIHSQPLEEEVQPQPSVSSSQTEVTYENYEAEHTNPTRHQGSSPNREEQSHKTETIYCVLELPAAAASKGSGCKETRDEKPPQEASNSQMDHSHQVNTVYSVLQKPKGMRPQRPLQDTQNNNTDIP